LLTSGVVSLASATVRKQSACRSSNSGRAPAQVHWSGVQPSKVGVHNHYDLARNGFPC
jgi:hypothetical protein